MPDCHLRFSKRLRFVLPVPGISLRDDKAGADKLRLLSVHLRPGSLRQSFFFYLSVCFIWSSGDLIFQSFDEVAVGYSSQSHGPDALLQ